MVPETKAVYNDEILHEAMARFGIRDDAIKDCGGFESFVYAYTKGGREFILKLTHNIRRNISMVQGELHWLNFLADRGVQVARGVPSESGNLVERIDLPDSYFMAYAFEKAEGSLTTKDDWSDETIHQWGSICGKMHRLTKAYQPDNPANVRPHWNEDAVYDFRKHLPDKQRSVLEKYRSFLEEIHDLPRDGDSYGLIHSDMHHHNFFLDQHGKITVFDFDDCEYHWFAYDLAVILYHSVNLFDRETIDLEFAQRFYDQLLKGYCTENTLSDVWLRHIPTFIKLRHYLFYALFHQVWEHDKLDEKQQMFLSRYKREIEEDVALLAIAY